MEAAGSGQSWVLWDGGGGWREDNDASLSGDTGRALGDGYADTRVHMRALTHTRTHAHTHTHTHTHAYTHTHTRTHTHTHTHRHTHTQVYTHIHNNTHTVCV